MAKQADGLKERIRGYIKESLADAASDFANLQFDLSAAETSPEQMKHSVNTQNRAELEQLAENYISRIERILADLKQLK